MTFTPAATSLLAVICLLMQHQFFTQEHTSNQQHRCRQRTLRELQVGQTLFKDQQGRWVIRHGPTDYKTGKAYGERPPMVLAPHIYPELEAFLDEWRIELAPRHDFVFSMANGRPLTDYSVYKIFATSCFRQVYRLMPIIGTRM